VDAACAFELEVVVSAAAHELVTLVEPAVQRVSLEFGVVLVEAEVPLADSVSGVLLRQKGREDRDLGIEAAAPVAGGVNADALLVAAEHKARPCGRADAAADIGLLEEDALAGQSVHVRRGDLRWVMRIEADIRIALVVGQDDDDVRPLLSPPPRPLSCGGSCRYCRRSHRCPGPSEKLPPCYVGHMSTVSVFQISHLAS